MKALYSFIAFVFFLSHPGRSQDLVSVTYLNTLTSNDLEAFVGTPVDYDVDTYKIVYTTTDVDGSNTIASGALCVPAGPLTCDSFPIGVYQHGTSLNKNDVPSRDVIEGIIGKIFAGGGFFMVLPDYLGMGDSPNLHPYCHGDSEATATLDMIRATRVFIQDSLGMSDNGELFITGYSQGGHAAMATHKYVQDNNLYNEFNIIASAPCSGPYEISGAMADTILAAAYSNPGYIVYVLASYQRVYGNIYNTYSDILNSPYDTIVVPYFDGNNYSLGMGELNDLLPNQVDLLIVDTVLQNFTNSQATYNHPLWQAMLDNDNHDWAPERPVRMYYCTEDEQVAFNNAIVAEATMNSNGANDVTAINMGPLDHNACVIPTLTDIFNWWQSLRSSCLLNVGVLENTLSLYPNPASEVLTIEWDGSGAINGVITDAMGRTILTITPFTGSSKISIANFSQGVYFVSLHNDKARVQSVFQKL